MGWRSRRLEEGDIYRTATILQFLYRFEVILSLSSVADKRLEVLFSIALEKLQQKSFPMAMFCIKVDSLNKFKNPNALTPL